MVADAVTTAGTGDGAGAVIPPGGLDFAQALTPTLDRLTTSLDSFDPERAIRSRLGEPPQGEGTAMKLDGLQDAILSAITRSRPVSVASEPHLTVNVEGSADEKTLAAVRAMLKDDLRRRDAELDSLIADAVSRAVP